jgi:hypothetical protein
VAGFVVGYGRTPHSAENSHLVIPAQAGGAFQQRSWSSQGVLRDNHIDVKSRDCKALSVSSGVGPAGYPFVQKKPATGAGFLGGISSLLRMQ